jgi:hypothetical protein
MMKGFFLVIHQITKLMMLNLLTQMALKRKVKT